MNMNAGFIMEAFHKYNDNVISYIDTILLLIVNVMRFTVISESGIEEADIDSSIQQAKIKPPAHEITDLTTVFFKVAKKLTETKKRVIGVTDAAAIVDDLGEYLTDLFEGFAQKYQYKDNNQ